MKRFTIFSLILIFMLGSMVYAQSDYNQKVRRKSVEIIQKVKRKEVEIKEKEDDLYTIKEQEEQVIAEEEEVPPTPIVEEEPVMDTTIVEEEEPIEAEEEPKKVALAERQFGIKAGSTAPGFGIAAEYTFLPISMSDTSALFTTAGIAYGTGNDYSALSLYINEVWNFFVDESMNAYVGGGINTPLSVDADSGKSDKGSIGLNAILGIEFPVNLFNNQNELMFIESGYNSLNVSSPDDTVGVFNLLGGYKFEF